MKYQLFFLFISLFFSCTNVRTEKANCADTMFVLGQTSLVAHLDTIEILWRPTSSVKCPQFKEALTRQRCYALDLDRLNKTNIKSNYSAILFSLSPSCHYLIDGGLIWLIAHNKKTLTTK